MIIRNFATVLVAILLLALPARGLTRSRVGRGPVRHSQERRWSCACATT